MKKIIKSLVIFMLVFLVGICMYHNVINPIEISSTKALCQNWDATYVGIKAFEERYGKEEYDKEKTILHNFNGKLPSDNAKDYMNVYISLRGENKSWFESFIVDGYISNIDKYSDMALYSLTISSVETMQIFRQSEKEGMIVLDIYVGNHTDDEIKEFIRGITIKTSSKGSLMGKKKSTISLSDLEEIIIER